MRSRFDHYRRGASCRTGLTGSVITGQSGRVHASGTHSRNRDHRYARRRGGAFHIPQRFRREGRIGVGEIWKGGQLMAEGLELGRGGLGAAQYFAGEALRKTGLKVVGVSLASYTGAQFAGHSGAEALKAWITVPGIKGLLLAGGRFVPIGASILAHNDMTKACAQ